MKKTLFAVTLIAMFSLSAFAAQHKTLPSSVHYKSSDIGKPITEKLHAPGPPSLCSPCLYYTGDINPNDPNADGFSDENTLLIANSSTYGAGIVPAGNGVTITGLFFQILASADFAGNSGSPTASYDIRTGVSEGNGGTSIASGTSVPAQVVATGRNAFGYNEYTVAVSFSALNLPPGTYWGNVTPDCTDGSDGTCSSGRFFASNTTQQTNAVHGMQQPNSQIYFNSAAFGFTWGNWCDGSLGLNAQQCEWLSFGASGTVNK